MSGKRKAKPDPHALGTGQDLRDRLMSSGLLRQPGGFEGFTAVGVSTEASDQPTVEVGDPRRRCVDGDTAVLSPAADVSQGERGVSDVANFLDLPVEGLPGFIDGRAVLGASVVAPRDGPFQGRPHRHDLCVASEKCIECRAIPSIEGSIRAPLLPHAATRLSGPTSPTQYPALGKQEEPARENVSPCLPR